MTISQLVSTYLTDEHTCHRLIQSLFTVKYFSFIIPPNANLNFGVASDFQASEELFGGPEDGSSTDVSQQKMT